VLGGNYSEKEEAMRVTKTLTTVLAAEIIFAVALAAEAKGFGPGFLGLR
jgi:hypothetical protein